jgi:hypothetical protein
MKLAQKGLLGSPLSLAVNSVHGVAFHRGLGEPLYPTSSVPQLGYLDAEDIAKFSEKAYTKENIAVVANGASHSEFSKWVGEFFQDTPSGSKLSGPASKYYGGEERIAHGSGNVLIIGFEGSSSFTAGSTYKPEIAVLAALLGGQSTIKWSPGFSLLARAADSFSGVNISTQHAGYSDAGLLYITFTGNAAQIAKASKEAVETLKKIAAGDVAEEDIKKATALAKFKALEAGQQTQPGLEATGNGLIEGGKPFQIDEIGSSISQVSADKVKAVSAGIVAPKRAYANCRAGGEGSLGQQGISISRWRSIQTTICRRDWAESLNRGSASWFGRAGWSVKLVNIRRRPKEDISKRVLRFCQDHGVCVAGISKCVSLVDNLPAKVLSEHIVSPWPSSRQQDPDCNFKGACINKQPGMFAPPRKPGVSAIPTKILSRHYRWSYIFLSDVLSLLLYKTPAPWTMTPSSWINSIHALVKLRWWPEQLRGQSRNLTRSISFLGGLIASGIRL